MDTQHLVRFFEQRPASENRVLCKITLPIEDAAKLEALMELYPHQTQTSIIGGLLHYSLNNLEVHSINLTD